jgi:hypothetical protein
MAPDLTVGSVVVALLAIAGGTAVVAVALRRGRRPARGPAPAGRLPHAVLLGTDPELTVDGGGVPVPAGVTYRVLGVTNHVAHVEADLPDGVVARGYLPTEHLPRPAHRRQWRIVR